PDLLAISSESATPRARSALREIPDPLEQVGSVGEEHDQPDEEWNRAPEHAPLSLHLDLLILQRCLLDSDLAALQRHELRQQLIRALRDSNNGSERRERARIALQSPPLVRSRPDGRVRGTGPEIGRAPPVTQMLDCGRAQCPI